MQKNRTPVMILFFFLVIVMPGFGVVLPLMAFFVTHFRASGSAFGVMMSLYSFMQFIFAPIWGMAILPFRWAMVLFSIIFSSGNFMLQPSVTSLISQRSSPAEQRAAMGTSNSFQSLVRATGPLWAGLAFDVYPTLSFWTGALIQLVGFVFSLRLLTRHERAPTLSTANE